MVVVLMGVTGSGKTTVGKVLAKELGWKFCDADDYHPAAKYIMLAKGRLPQLAEASTDRWLTEMPFFGGLKRQRIWTFWRRVLHTCHHRTQVQTWLRLAGRHVPAIYGPSGDVKWDDADPTYSLEAAERGG